jgi:16S rRNA (cytosine967-C5)-methyltransferase
VKLFRNLCVAVVESLNVIFNANKYADKVIEKTLKQNPKWGARDRRFIAETTYDIVRWHRLYRHATESNDHWILLGAWCAQHNIDLPGWTEFENIDTHLIKSRLNDPELHRSIKESIPDWMDQLCASELGNRWDEELNALNHEAEVVLRVNTLKTSKAELGKLLDSEGTETMTVDNFPDALVLKKRLNIFRSPTFKEGLFEVQDAGSQLIAPFLRVKEGQRVIDACAGAGGKTLHLASLMNNKGRIIALDTEAWKLDELRKRARRAGVSNIETREITSSKVSKRLENTADRLLLDVPCSGLGVLRRNPDAKWKLSLEFIEKVKLVQQQILKDYSDMVKPGGLMVYATCSILPSENENQVKQFIESHANFELVEERHLWPSEGFDGFYIALVRRR